MACGPFTAIRQEYDAQDSIVKVPYGELMNNNYVHDTLGAYAIINAQQVQGLLGQAHGDT